MQQPTKQDSQKRVWMMTYCPPGTYITAEMLAKHELDADEVHSTSDRVMNYTYVHLRRKVRKATVAAFLNAVRQTHGIIQSEVFGYDALASDVRSGDERHRLQDHIVFSMLVKHCTEQKPTFKPWTAGEHELLRGPLFQVVMCCLGCCSCCLSPDVPRPSMPASRLPMLSLSPSSRC